MRTGLELELLAPEGKTRFDVAHALAASVGGSVQYGLKHIVSGFIQPERPRCALSSAARVLDSDGAPWLTLVDDITIRDELFAAGDNAADFGGMARVPIVLLDDVRLSKWLEARSFRALPAWNAQAHASLLTPMLETFDAHLSERDPLSKQPVLDPWGQVLAVVMMEPAAHHRVCEVVTQPIDRDDEREYLVSAILDVARALSCTIPIAAALHVHIDAEPFRDMTTLCRFIRNWSEQREDIMRRLKPNPACKKLGPFPEKVVRVARECPPELGFNGLCAALRMAGATKDLDVNLLGVIDRHPVQPTLEIRCLPMSLEPAQVLASINEALAVVEECVR